MNLTEEIDQFLLGKLTPDEKHAFQLKINADPQLAEEIIYQQLANEAIVDSKLVELNQKIREDLDKLDSASLLNKWVIGSSIVFIIGVGTVLLNFNDSEKNDKKINAENLILHPQKVEELDEVIIEENMQKHSFKNSKQAYSNIKQDQNQSDVQATGKYINPGIDSSNKDIVPEDKTLPNNYLNPQLHPDISNEVIKSPCNTMVLTYLPDTKESCHNKATGEISIMPNAINGGTAPYKFSIDNGIHFQTAYVFSNIREGDYYLTILDNENCKQTFSTVLYIQAKHCNQEHSYSFNPLNGEKWQYPLKNTSGGEMEIKNKLGQRVYSTNWSAGMENVEWDGAIQNVPGATIIGEYIYMIIYTNGETENGYVSIVK